MEKDDVQKYLNAIKASYSNIQLLAKAEIAPTAPIMIGEVGCLERHIKNLVDSVLDAEMDRVAEELPSLDEIFEGDPVSDFTQAVLSQIDELDGEDSLEDFAKVVAESIPFSADQEDYKSKFTGELADAIETVLQRGGYSQFLVAADGKSLEGTINTKRGEVEVSVNGKDFLYDSGSQDDDYDHNDDEEEVYECTGDIRSCDCGYDDYTSACEYEQEELFEPQIDKSQYLVGELHEDISNLDEVYYNQVHANMELIRGVLGDKVPTTPEELDLVRYYLKNQPVPYAKDEVDELSYRALITAWNFYYKNK